MNKKSKLISGFMKINPRLQERVYLTVDQKHTLIKEMLAGDLTKREIWKKYTGQEEEHGHILRWMRKLGYISNERPSFVSNSYSMKAKDETKQDSESFEILQLKKRIEELENQLKDAEMKAIAFSTMVDIAERQFNIPIRKKVNTKPLKK
jgi:hypothetical protein